MIKKLHFTIVFILLLSLITGCSHAGEAELPSDPSPEENSVSMESPEIEAPKVDPEPVYPLFHSLDELSSYLSENTDIDSYYAPDAESLPGYVLIQIEVLADCSILYYYMHTDYLPADYVPADHLTPPPELMMLLYSRGVMVTCHTDDAYTLHSLSNQRGIAIDSDGYIYDEERGELIFALDAPPVSVRVPDELNDYETIKALCTMEKISLK